MQIAERVQWLQAHTPLGELSAAVLEAIASQIEVEQVAENRRLVLEDTPPTALYILKSGRLERYRTSPDRLASAVSLLPGSVLHLKQLLLERPAEETVMTLSDCEIWTVPAAAFAALVVQYPEISQTVSRQMAADLDQMTAQLAFEQERQTALRPYLMPKVQRGVSMVLVGMPPGCGKICAKQQAIATRC